MLFRFALVLSIGIGLWAASKEAPPGLRLPATVRPVKQSAELTLVPGSDTFQGRIDFDLDVREPRDIIWVNATDLNISSATVNGEPAEVTPGTKAVTGITPKKSIPAGAARLHTEYEGRIG